MSSGRIDETSIKVRGQWACLSRALDKFGNTIDFYLSATRDTKATKRFHGKLKQLIQSVRGFKTMKTGYATIKGFEVMRTLHKGQAGLPSFEGGIVGEARLVERAFGMGPCALSVAVALVQDRLAGVQS